MSVKIRLHRSGATHSPFYRVVVTDSRSPRDGRFIEMIGYYDPLPETTVLKLDTERVQHWIDRGATPSPTVKSLIKRAGTLPTAADVASKAREKRAQAIEEASRLAPVKAPKADKGEKSEKADASDRAEKTAKAAKADKPENATAETKATDAPPADAK